MFVELGRALERIAGALESRDAGAAERALVDARGIDPLIRSVEEEIGTGRETARYTPPRRSSRALLERYERSIPQIDYAVRNTRVLARNVVALVRDSDDVPENLPGAVRDLSHAVWELAASYDAPSHAEPGPPARRPRRQRGRRGPDRAARRRARRRPGPLRRGRPRARRRARRRRRRADARAPTEELLVAPASPRRRRLTLRCAPGFRSPAGLLRSPDGRPGRTRPEPLRLATWHAGEGDHVRITPLYRSPVVSLGTFWCAPDDVRWEQENYVGDVAHIAFPATPVWIDAQGEEAALAGPNHAMFFNAGDVFRRRRFNGHGDRNHFMVVGEDTMEEWLRAARFPKPGRQAAAAAVPDGRARSRARSPTAPTGWPSRSGCWRSGTRR